MMMATRSMRSALGIFLLLAAASCSNPIEIDTPRRLTRVNLDSVVASDPFIGAPGDSIFADIDGNAVVFATEVLRPLFYNRKVSDGYYVTVQATRYGLDGRDYEVLSLRLDAIPDTGTYAINAPYSAPKKIDSLASPKYGALYERRLGGGFPEAYRTGTQDAVGTIRVLKIDEARGVMVGTFSFTGYCSERDTIVSISRGAFRLQLTRQ